MSCGSALRFSASTYARAQNSYSALVHSVGRSVSDRRLTKFLDGHLIMVHREQLENGAERTLSVFSTGKISFVEPRGFSHTGHLPALSQVLSLSEGDTMQTRYGRKNQKQKQVRRRDHKHSLYRRDLSHGASLRRAFCFFFNVINCMSASLALGRSVRSFTFGESANAVCSALSSHSTSLWRISRSRYDRSTAAVHCPWDINSSGGSSPQTRRRCLGISCGLGAAKSKFVTKPRLVR